MIIVIKNYLKNFLNNANYVCFFCELFENDNLQTIGNNTIDLEFAKLFFGNTKQLFLCNTRNINYLLKHNIYNNITYFPPIGYSKLTINKYKIRHDPNKINDILFYGNILNFIYRKDIINDIQNICKENKYKFIIREDLYDENEKKDILAKTKIVIHIPSHKNLHSFPWAKVSELILSKVFFIIEENEEMYIKGLDKLCAFYKRNDRVDLENKIKYYINNESERINITTKCYKYFTFNYNIDTILNKFNLQSK